jgi:light-regulated signal transduction histidine kinase (bacteriophytochrome)
LNAVTNDNPEKVKNKKVSEIFPTVFHSGVFENLVDAIENDNVVEYEVPYEGNGENQWFSATAIKLNDGVTVTTRNITEERQKTEALRSNNHELIRSNEELQSFNRVVSHDLQEPLRKIQLFISRISEDDKETLSEKLRLYFDKIESAAERMQTLINNLLTYSSMEGKHRNFESVNLNEILEKVKADLVNTIDETGAILNFGNLPIIKGVSHQFEQLFSNLISNAIKYRSENRIPQITIRSEKISRNKLPEIFYKSENFYHKITVTDNGIGFHAKHSKKIFEVFQRLHHKSEYSGTGIGLSICKKVVENHRGYIFATSEPEKGSVFVLYLPA